MALAILFAGCGGQAEPGPASRREAERVRPLGRSLCQQLQQRLRQELVGALEAGGPLQALDVCATRAQTWTREQGESARPVAELKRLSRRARNPKNTPDDWELQALEYFESAERASGHLPEDWVQRLNRGGELRYRYYMPIRTGVPCLPCHGAPEAMPDTVRSILAERYPQDASTGFAEGALQGLVRVEWNAQDLPQQKDRP